VTDIHRIGWSSGLVLLMTGGSMSVGRWRCAAATLFCTSCRASAMLRESSNSMLMVAEA
jgi:hypothetical protein